VSAFSRLMCDPASFLFKFYQPRTLLLPLCTKRITSASAGVEKVFSALLIAAYILFHEFVPFVPILAGPLPNPSNCDTMACLVFPLFCLKAFPITSLLRGRRINAFHQSSHSVGFLFFCCGFQGGGAPPSYMICKPPPRVQNPPTELLKTPLTAVFLEDIRSFAFSVLGEVL